jgi:hypothetical protein
MLDGPNITFRFQDADEFLFNLLLCAELETFHASDDMSIQIIRPEGFSMDKMDRRWTRESTNHPRMTHHFL